MTAARAALACVLALATGACASLGNSSSIEETSAGVERAASISPAQAQVQVQPGASKAAVIAALGPANVIAFDSGWEVWVYRWLGADRSARSATEFVLLFDPQGVLKKSRVRPGEPPQR